MGAETILDFAIAQEEEASTFYLDLAARVNNPGMKTVFEDFAKEEQGHKARLEAIKAGESLRTVGQKVIDLKISDYLVDIDPDKDPLDYQNALIIAMKKEKAAFRMYSDMAEGVSDPALRELFLSLAQEEAKHKLRFEVEYDERILSEN
jgi:rubrerythrin